MTRSGTFGLVAAAAVVGAALASFAGAGGDEASRLGAEQLDMLREIAGRLRSIESALAEAPPRTPAPLPSPPSSEPRPLVPADDPDLAAALRSLRDAIDGLRAGDAPAPRAADVTPDAAASALAAIVRSFAGPEALRPGGQITLPELAGMTPPQVRRLLGPPAKVQSYADSGVYWSYGDPLGLGKPFRIVFVDGYMAYATYR